jgi:CheY-like chemotaxis protein
MEAVGALAGGLVHEFNNRLTVVLGNLDRLRLQFPDDIDSRHLAQRLEEAALAMGNTVRQLKALSHQAPLPGFPQPLSRALAPFLSSARELPARITFQASLDQDPVVTLDPDLLNQALQRLLTNAVEALPGPGAIGLRAWQDGTSVHLVLEDSGLGMSPEVLHRACDPFFTTKPPAPGLGLGLSTAFALTRQMGGQLLIESQPGRGTRVELVLPLGRLEPPTSAIRVPDTLHLRRILLADDEAGIRELTREFLEGEGFQVTEARDGQEAVEAFEADPQAWGLVILDLVMPRLDGAEVLHRIQHLRPELPALLISGYSTLPHPGLLDGPHRRFLAKPFRLQDLSKALDAFGLAGSSPL